MHRQEILIEEEHMTAQSASDLQEGVSSETRSCTG